MTYQDPSAYERYEAARDQIRHENEVVNHRLGWFLAIEGFLLAGFFGALGLYQTVSAVPHAWMFLSFGLVTIGALGIVVSVLTRRTIGWAYKQAKSAADWWVKEQQDGITLSTKFPDITLPVPEGGWPKLRTTTLPTCFILVWCVLLLLLTAALVTAHCARQAQGAVSSPTCSPVSKRRIEPPTSSLGSDQTQRPPAMTSGRAGVGTPLRWRALAGAGPFVATPLSKICARWEVGRARRRS